MVEANSQVKLLPTSILDIYKVIEHIYMLSIGIWLQPYTVIPTLLSSDFGVLGHFVEKRCFSLAALPISLYRDIPKPNVDLHGRVDTAGPPRAD